MANEKLNGSVDRLAHALRDVFVEAMESVGRDIKTEIRTDMQAMEERIEKQIEERLYQNRKDVVEDVKNTLRSRGL